jgi:putative membrane protein
MKLIFKIAPFAMAGLLALSSCGKKEAPENTNETAEEANEQKFEERKDEKDAEFVAETAAANYAEIALAKLGSEKSDNAQIKEVAAMLVTDHEKVLGEVQTFASAKAITLPTEATDEGQKKVEDLRKEEKISNFNKDWTKTLIDKHEKSISNFESRLEKTEDADLKIWIDQTLPHLRMHLEKLKTIEEGLKNAK